MTICMCDGGGSIGHAPSLRCTVVHAHLRVALYECNACGARYPVMPYYPIAAAHGPDLRCSGELGWTVVREDFPPRPARGDRSSAR